MVQKHTFLVTVVFYLSSIAVTRSKDVPTFGPHFTDGALFKRGPDFAEFLLTKGKICLYFEEIVNYVAVVIFGLNYFKGLLFSFNVFYALFKLTG